jgi:hypothetical protein
MQKDNGSGSGPRLYIDPITRHGGFPGGHKFRNTETTVYARLAGGTLSGNGGIIIGARTGPFAHGPNDDHCLATTYYGRYLAGGSVNFYKELVHATDSEPQTTQGRGPGQGAIRSEWIGVKYIVRDIASRGHVKFELWVDKTNGANGGDWRKVTEYIDSGRWESNDSEMSKCVRQGKRTGNREIITAAKSGGVTLIRNTWPDNSSNDNVSMEYKMMTIREITPLP